MLYVYWETVAMYVLWTLLMMIPSKTFRRIAAVAGTAAAVLVILSFTVFGRRTGSGSGEVSLQPFVTFALAKQQPEYYRTMYMNFFLFLPLGLALPHVLPDKLRGRAAVTLAAGLALSVGAELCQYFFRFGRCETDDVLMNALGVLVGATSWYISRLLRKKLLRER